MWTAAPFADRFARRLAAPPALPACGRAAAAAALVTLLLTGPAAEAEPYVLDESHAAVTFSVDHLGFSAVIGRFRHFDAQIDFDPEAVEQTRVRFVVDVASIDTNWDRRDEDLLGPNFFAVTRWPSIIFESTRVTPTGTDAAEVTGLLTIRDVTREVTLQAELNRLGTSPLTGKPVAGFTVTGTIDRRDFGMGYAAPDIGAEVPVRIEIEMSPAA